MVVPLLGALAVWMTFLLGRRLSDGVTGVVAAVLGGQPDFLYQLVQPMSDVAVVAWVTAAIVLAARPTVPSAALAGLSAGLAILTRPNLAPFVVPIVGFIAAATETGRGDRLRPGCRRDRPRRGRGTGLRSV